jgi:hypothetical protein
MCDAAFGAGDIARIAGAPVAGPVQATSERSGVGTCTHSLGPVAGTDDPRPGRVALRVDCRPESQSVRAWQQTLLAVEGGASYREVDLGHGGAFAHSTSLNTRQIIFVHDRIPCAVQVSVSDVEPDFVDTLAAHAYDALAQIRPTLPIGVRDEP